jgi:hypothetical protein
MNPQLRILLAIVFLLLCVAAENVVLRRRRDRARGAAQVAMATSTNAPLAMHVVNHAFEAGMVKMGCSNAFWICIFERDGKCYGALFRSNENVTVGEMVPPMVIHGADRHRL